MPVFEASESIVSTFQALILVLILVVLDSPTFLSSSLSLHLTLAYFLSCCYIR